MKQLRILLRRLVQRLYRRRLKLRRAGIYLMRYLFHGVLVRPLLALMIGIYVRNPERLPNSGPAMLAANHNSHLDTVALQGLFPLRRLPKVRPVAAVDYFGKGDLMSWIAQYLMGILPIDRKGREKGFDPLLPCYAALERKETLIIFPEGTRGEPETLQPFKKGIAFIAEKYPHVPVYPLFLHGMGKVLPKGAFFPVPLFCDVWVGEKMPPFTEFKDHQAYVTELESRIRTLMTSHYRPEWD